MQPKGIEPKKVSEVPLTEATIELVHAGIGISVMPKWAIKPHIEAGKVCCKRINKNGLYRLHYLARLKGNELPEYFNIFIMYIKEKMNLLVDV